MRVEPNTKFPKMSFKAWITGVLIPAGTTLIVFILSEEYGDQVLRALPDWLVNFLFAVEPYVAPAAGIIGIIGVLVMMVIFMGMSNWGVE